MTLDQLQDVLDDSFGDGPPITPPAARLAAGQAALRRRRRLAMAGAATAVVVIAGGATAFGRGGTAPRGAEPVAPAPSASSSASESAVDEAQLEEERQRIARQQRREHKRQQLLVSNAFPASLDSDGTLVVRDGWKVVQQVPNPMGYTSPESSLGVVVTKADTTRWMLLYLEHGEDRQGNERPDSMSAGASADDAGKGYSRYEDWLASMVELQGGAETPPLVLVSADDVVTAGPGATLVAVQEIPVVDGYTSPGDRVARVTRDGRTWWVVVRGHGADAERIPVDGDVLPESTLDALLSYLAQQTQSGEGVR